MEASLTGRLILIAEDEPLIAFEIMQGFEEEGARVIMARTLAEGLRAVEDPALSAAILDHALTDGDTSEICERTQDPVRHLQRLRRPCGGLPGRCAREQASKHVGAGGNC